MRTLGGNGGFGPGLLRVAVTSSAEGGWHTGMIPLARSERHGLHRRWACGGLLIDVNSVSGLTWPQSLHLRTVGLPGTDWLIPYPVSCDATQTLGSGNDCCILGPFVTGWARSVLCSGAAGELIA
jgi:hypothetical protein